uniref:Uncharacterized protein n=1 Tax=Setaria digitata TaxID=48799 RepID=A0A915Q5U4_9BILA
MPCHGLRYRSRSRRSRSRSTTRKPYYTRYISRSPVSRRSYRQRRRKPSRILYQSYRMTEGNKSDSLRLRRFSRSRRPRRRLSRSRSYSRIRRLRSPYRYSRRTRQSVPRRRTSRLTRRR